MLNHCGSKAGVLLAAGELFSERVRDLEIDAVAGDVASVVRTTCRRYRGRAAPLSEQLRAEAESGAAVAELEALAGVVRAAGPRP